MSRLTSIISLKDNYSAVMRRAAQQTKSFKKDVEATKKSLDAAFKREQNIRIANSAANKAILQTIKAMKPLRDKAVMITAKTQKFWEKYNPAQSALWRLTKSTYTVGLKLKDNVSSGLASIRNVLAKPLMVGASMAAGAGAAAIGVGTMALKGASGLERQQISMEHFIGVNNKSMSADQVKAEADKYLADLRKNADLTPFETGEVISTGTRAIGISGGDTKEAMSLLRLSEDMAALNPGKTLSDAIEALADLKTGETERMKEFGFKINQDQIKAAGGKMSNLKNDKGIAITEMFNGGSDKLSNSAEGLWSTITGTMKSGITNMGVKSLEVMKPQLKKWADYLSSGGADKLFQAGSKMMESIIQATIEKSKKVEQWISAKFLNNVEFQNLPTLRDKFRFVLGELKKEFDGWWEESGKSMFHGIAETGAQILSDAAPLFADPALKIGAAIGRGLIDGLKNTIADHPILSSLSTGAVGAVAGGMIGGPWGAAIGGGLGILGGAGTSLYFNTSPERKINEKYNFYQKLDDANAKGNPLWENTQMVDPNSLKKRAIGVTRVPYDNYPLLLHQNESVLTAQEASQYRNGGNKSNVTINNYGPVIKDEPSYEGFMRRLKLDLEAAGFNMV